MVSTYLLAMILGITLPLLTSIGSDLLGNERPLLLGFFLILFRTPVQVNLLLFYSIFITVYATCFLASFVTNGGFLRGLRILARGTIQPRVPNWLIVMPLISSALLVVVVIITLLQDTLGFSTGSLPRVDPYLTLYSFAYAPILEEWAFRITPLGLVVLLRVIRSDNWASLFVFSFLSPEKAKAKAGLRRIFDAGWKGVHWSEWFAVAATSILFGLAHVVSGAGWELGKFTTSTIQGLVIGITFLVYGFYAPILLHWFFDFYFVVLSVAEDQLGGIFATLSTFVFFATFAVGSIGLAAMARWFLLERRESDPTTPYKTPGELPPC